MHKLLEQVQQYKYLGSIINDSNSIEEEVKERIALGIKAYYANQKIKSRLVTKCSKLKLYRTVIRPIIRIRNTGAEINHNSEIACL